MYLYLLIDCFLHTVAEIHSYLHQIIRAGDTAALARWGMPAPICIESLVL